MFLSMLFLNMFRWIDIVCFSVVIGKCVVLYLFWFMFGNYYYCYVDFGFCEEVDCVVKELSGMVMNGVVVCFFIVWDGRGFN